MYVEKIIIYSIMFTILLIMTTRYVAKLIIDFIKTIRSE